MHDVAFFGRFREFFVVALKGVGEQTVRRLLSEVRLAVVLAAVCQRAADDDAIAGAR